jgi:hypothetical protein
MIRNPPGDNTVRNARVTWIAQTSNRIANFEFSGMTGGALESELTRTREALGTITEERTKLAAQGDAHRLLLAEPGQSQLGLGGAAD